MKPVYICSFSCGVVISYLTMEALEVRYDTVVVTAVKFTRGVTQPAQQLPAIKPTKEKHAIKAPRRDRAGGAERCRPPGRTERGQTPRR